MKAVYLIYAFALLFLIAVLLRIKPIAQKLQALRQPKAETQQEEVLDLGQLEFGDMTENQREEAKSVEFEQLPATGPAENLAILSASLVLTSAGAALVLKK